MSGRFRFESLEIWHEAIRLAHELFKIANELEQKKLWRLSDQLRGAAIGIPNNISESTGSDMAGEQIQLLRYSRREIFEAANMLAILELEKLINTERKLVLLHDLEQLSRRVTAYSRTIK